MSEGPDEAQYDRELLDVLGRSTDNSKETAVEHRLPAIEINGEAVSSVESIIESSDQTLETNPWDQIDTYTPAQAISPSTATSADDTISFRGSWSVGSVAESQGSITNGTNREAHRNYLYPLRSRRYDGLRSSLLSPAGGLSPNPGSLRPQSRSSSQASIVSLSYLTDDHTQAKPEENIKWTKLRKLNDRLYNEAGRRVFGSPTCLSVSGFLALGTTKGFVLIFDYQQVCKFVLGAGTIGTSSNIPLLTEAVEAGGVTSVAISADHTFVLAGHANGSIFSWELRKPGSFARHIPPITMADTAKSSGHLRDLLITHVDFIGARHSAFISADSSGMVFLHTFNRKMLLSSVDSIRLLGRYPSVSTIKPSVIYSMTTLPLGTVAHETDEFGLVCIITPHKLVVVSSTPIPRTQYKINRPSGLIAESSDICACAAWFPSISVENRITPPMLAYSWCRQLFIISANTVSGQVRFNKYQNHKLDDTVISIQWYSRDIICLLTRSAKLQLIDIHGLQLIGQCDIIHKQVLHHDIYRAQLSQYFQEREAEFVNQTFSDSFSQSIQVYKSKVFLLGVNDVSIGAVLTWNDRVAALLHAGQHITAVKTLSEYYTGVGEIRALGLPDSEQLRKDKLKPRMYEVMLAAIRFSQQSEDLAVRSDVHQAKLIEACFDACLLLEDHQFLFDKVFELYENVDQAQPFLDALAKHILSGDIAAVPPQIMQQLVHQYADSGLYNRLEDIICLMTPESLDFNQISQLCKAHDLYNALAYVWTRALHDYVTPMIEFLSLIKAVMRATQTSNGINGISRDMQKLGINTVNAVKVFSYLSLTLSGRIYPTAAFNPEGNLAKSSLYDFLFSGRNIVWPPGSQTWITTSDDAPESTFPYLRLLLSFDCPTFLASMDEAFEDSFLNADEDSKSGRQTVTRQFIVNILLEVMSTDFPADDVIYLYIFISRNVPKYSQFILLSGSVLQRILIGLCQCSDPELADDCQLSVEYLLSVYRPTNSEEMTLHYREARFNRVLKSVYRSERNWSGLLVAHLGDSGQEHLTLDCLEELLGPSSRLNELEMQDVEDTALEQIVAIASLDGARTAEIIHHYNARLHLKVFDKLLTREGLLYIYLRRLCDTSQADWMTQAIREHYIELLCIYDRQQIIIYMKSLRLDDINFDRTIDILEKFDLIDAIVFLLCAQNQVEEALHRITKHLAASNKSLVDSLSATDIEASTAVADSIAKYIRVGLQLCKTETRHGQEHCRIDIEVMWLRFLSTIYDLQVTLSTTQHVKPPSTLRSRLKKTIQESFSDFIISTTNHKSISIVNIMQRFLQYSASTTSFSALRPILRDVFDSHQYQFQLLALADSIFNSDLYLQLATRTMKNNRGWAVNETICSICGDPLFDTRLITVSFKAHQATLTQHKTDRKLNRLQDVERRHGLHPLRSAGKQRERPTSPQPSVTSTHNHGDTIISYACGHVAHESCTQHHQSLHHHQQSRVSCTICDTPNSIPTHTFIY